MSLKNLLDRCSPIGILPANYPHLKDLCKIAHIAYRDVQIGKTSHRDWYVVFDEMQYPKKRRTPTGKIVTDNSRMVQGSMEHMKFCAILDYIQFRGEAIHKSAGIPGNLNWENVLDLAIGRARDLILANGDTVELGEKISRLRLKSYRAVAKDLSSEGMRKYDVVASVASPDDDLPNFE